MPSTKPNPSTNMTFEKMVSVVIPVFNHEIYIREAINSIFQQNFRDLEIVLVDDGSSDNSMNVAREKLKGAAVPYQIYKQTNQGAHAAINRGISMARGEWIAILNSDDRYSPFRISKLVDHALETNSRFVFSRVGHMDGNGLSLLPTASHLYYYNWSVDNKDLYPTPNFEFLRHNYAITTGNFFFHRSLFDEIGPFRDFKICHDWDFILRALLVTEISFLNEELYEYRVHPNNTLRPSVQELRYQEMDDLLSSYLENAETASNPLAPCYKNWGNYWTRFVGSQIPFGYLPKTSKAIEQILDHSASDENIIPDQANHDRLINALENSQKKVLRLEEELLNTKKYFESQINKSLPVLIKERLKAGVLGFYSKLISFSGKKKK